MRRALFLIFILSAFVLAQDARITVPYTRFTLPNGLNVILHEDHSVPRVGVNIWYHVGSANEKPGKNGFAHLFEHIMFEGSGHVPPKQFDLWLEAAGGDNNASTAEDRTNYYENIPSNALELPLFLESDRMGYLLTTMSPAKVDGQRDVVKNERRQSYENQPYGLAYITINENLYPPAHPYHFSTIGSMKDLTNASYDDVVDFFKTYYLPNNASLCIAGDIDVAQTKALVTKWFADVPMGNPPPPLSYPTPVMTEEKRIVQEDSMVQELPRLYMAWISPRWLAPGDAELDIMANVLAGGKTSRLYKRLVYDLQIAQDVSAFEASAALSSQFIITSTARSGHTLSEIEKVIQEEIDKLKADPPTDVEVQRAVNQFEASFLDRLEGAAGKADQLNYYYTLTGNPDYFNEDVSRYKAVDAKDVQTMGITYLKDNARVVLSVVPVGKKELAATKGGK